MLAKGVKVSLGAGDGPPESFNQIINVTSFTLSGTTWATEDVSSHDNAVPVKNTATTIRDEGKVSLIISPYVRGDQYHAALRTLSLSGAANNFKVTYPGDQMGSFQFSGYVSSFSYDTPVLGLLKGKVDILVNGALLDDAANLLSVVVTDANAPNYTTGETLELTATFDEIVNVTGVPKIAVALTSGTVYANYASGTDTNVLKFSHVIGSGDASEAGTMTVGTLGLNGGSILDFGGNVAVVTFVAPTTTTFSVNHSA